LRGGATIIRVPVEASDLLERPLGCDDAMAVAKSIKVFLQVRREVA